MNRKKPRICPQCQVRFMGGNDRTFCSPKCRNKCGQQVGRHRTERQISGAEVVAILDAAAKRENAPPWERHPIPWDNVAGARA